MAGMPRITGLLKNGPKIQATAAKNFSFTVSGQDSAKVGWSIITPSLAIEQWADRNLFPKRGINRTTFNAAIKICKI